ncbi:MAG: hypothetical protein LUD84_10910 [Clostridiales bacterium]|nr:hypothetical protein [Clostridiales bacterium]
MTAIFQDIVATARLFPAVREARQNGAVRVQAVYPVKEYIVGASWLDTMEGMMMYDGNAQVGALFLDFSPEQRHWLASTPKHRGGWAERLRFWMNVLEPVLPPDLYLDTILQYSANYRRAILLERRATQ